MHTLKIKIGKAMLEYQANDMEDIHKFHSYMGMLPEVCDSCQSQNIFLNHRQVIGKEGDKAGKVFNYYGVRCKDCGATLNFQKSDTGYYISWDKKMEKYDGGG